MQQDPFWRQALARLARGDGGDDGGGDVISAYAADYGAFDDEFCCVVDKFPKAAPHFLVLRKALAAPPSGNERDPAGGASASCVFGAISSAAGANGEDGEGEKGGKRHAEGESRSASAGTRRGVSDLSAGDAKALRRMRAVAVRLWQKHVEERSRDAIGDAIGDAAAAADGGGEKGWKEKLDMQGCMMGFHANPSLEPLHLHVLSAATLGDRRASSAVRMKHRKHWNSFTTPFFVPLDAVLAVLEEGESGDVEPSLVRERLLDLCGGGPKLAEKRWIAEAAMRCPACVDHSEGDDSEDDGFAVVPRSTSRSRRRSLHRPPLFASTF